MTEQQRDKQRESAKLWREKHRDEQRVKNRKFRMEHPDYMRQWKAKNPTYHSNWGTKNRGRLREYAMRWRQSGGMVREKLPKIGTLHAMSYEEIGNRLGMDRETVREVERRALRKLADSDLGNLIELAALLEQFRAQRQWVEIRK